jgi:hypothetical protein
MVSIAGRGDRVFQTDPLLSCARPVENDEKKPDWLAEEA